MPGGSLRPLDMAHPEADARGWSARMLRSNPHLKDNSPGRVLKLMAQAGFAEAKRIDRGAILFGLLRNATTRLPLADKAWRHIIFVRLRISHSSNE